MAGADGKISMEWGFAGPWYWELQQMDEDHGLNAKLKFFAHYKLTYMSMGVDTVHNMSVSERESEMISPDGMDPLECFEKSRDGAVKVDFKKFLWYHSTLYDILNMLNHSISSLISKSF